MKKLAEKVALVALICITMVFVITAVLYITGTLNNYESNDLYDKNGQLVQMSDNSIILVLMLVLAVLYAGLAAYLLFMMFSERANLKQILLFCDSDSATRTNIKVINNIVKGCAQQVEGIRVKKMRVRSDEKGGFIATMAVKVRAEDVAKNINKLRCLIEDSFKKTLNLTFNTINFEVTKLHGKYMPDVERADEIAENMQEKQEMCEDNYQNPKAPLDAKEDAAEPEVVQSVEVKNDKAKNNEKEKNAEKEKEVVEA